MEELGYHVFTLWQLSHDVIIDDDAEAIITDLDSANDIGRVELPFPGKGFDEFLAIALLDVDRMVVVCSLLVIVLAGLDVKAVF